ncbi:quinoprotein dehydrogenase-associated SoxYZ-like carrier [Ralstonia sp. UNC404CL21Col]|uniref:quinoprotein dehydrogenase-associated SoxYZ-like carrier n=1 Tax=Ralstonia sp. UNC404CL21Col TaxID=1380362 RepID=UPI0004844326|nr:quinoprotein dehydrogenase-associated SoxYZ-like carrier [Ralstonia sp. UNC404CL21Col]
MRTAPLHAAAAAALAVACLSSQACADTNVDPAGSPLWPTIRQEVFGPARTTFDNRIRITGPAFAEDPMQVPIAFDASALGKVERIIVVVDRNPIRKVLEFTPMRARPALSFRFKLQEASALRVAARTQDGVWHVGTLQVDATGGGCTLPGATRQNATWSTTLNQVESRVFPGFNGAGSRIRVRVMHPMDTGLVAGIPSFHIEQLNLLDAKRQPMLELALYEPVAENPIFSFDIDGPVERGISVAGVDNNGNRIRAQVTR